MQGSTGFTYFIAFASVISAFMSIFFAIEFPVIVPYFEDRNSKKTWLIQAIQGILFIVLAGAISFLTWCAVEEDFGEIHYNALAILYITSFLFYTAFAHKDHPLASSHFQKCVMQIGLVFYVVMLPGLTCFAASYRNQTMTGEYSEIDMLIQNSRVEFDGDYPCASSSGTCGAYKATLNVNWGHDWACPNNEDVWCDEWIEETDCIVLVDRTTTTQTEFSILAGQVEECIKIKYGLPVLGHLDKELYPFLEDRWPEIPFFGTCSSRCATEPLDTDLFEDAERVKLAGIILCCSGSVLFVIYYWLIFGKYMLDTCYACLCGGCRRRQPKDLSSIWHSFISGLILYDVELAAASNSTRRSQEGEVDPTYLEEDSSSEIEIDRTTTTTPERPVHIMAEASILYSDDEEDDAEEEDDEYEEDYDEEECVSSSSDEEEMSSAEDDSEDEESLDSCYDESTMDDIDLSAKSCEPEESAVGIRCSNESELVRTASAVEEVDIDV